MHMHFSKERKQPAGQAAVPSPRLDERGNALLWHTKNKTQTPSVEASYKHPRTWGGRSGEKMHSRVAETPNTHKKKQEKAKKKKNDVFVRRLYSIYFRI